MAKIEVRGYAEKEVNCDLVEVTVTFKAKEKTVARASEEVMKQSEVFLKRLKGKGINVDEIHFQEDSIDESRSYREEQFTIAKRTIQMIFPFAMDFMNYIMELIQNHGGDVEYETEYRLSMQEELHVELRNEAMLDAKKKAEDIATTLGMSVVSLKTATLSNYYGGNDMLNIMKLSDDEDCDYCDEEYLSNDLRSAVVKESEAIHTVWIIE